MWTPCLPPLGSLWAPFGLHFRTLAPLWAPFGSHWTPFGLPLAPFWPPLVPFWSPLLPFWAFGSIFDRFWITFGSMLASFVDDCSTHFRYRCLNDLLIVFWCQKGIRSMLLGIVFWCFLNVFVCVGASKRKGRLSFWLSKTYCFFRIQGIQTVRVLGIFCTSTLRFPTPRRRLFPHRFVIDFWCILASF